MDGKSSQFLDIQSIHVVAGMNQEKGHAVDTIKNAYYDNLFVQASTPKECNKDPKIQY